MLHCRFKHLVSALAGLLLAGSAASAVAVTPFEKTYREWTLYCDNGARCEAMSDASPQADMQMMLVRLLRDPGPGARMRLEFRAMSHLSSGDLGLDGKAFKSAPGSWRLETDYSNQPVYYLSTDDTAVIAAWIAQARSARTATLAGAGAGKGRRQASLAGLSAALLAIDERQGRLDTIDAWQRNGSKPGHSVPAPPPLPRIQRLATAVDALSQAQAQQLQKSVQQQFPQALSRCGVPDEPVEMKQQRSAHHVAYAVSASEALVGLACDLGAYNITHLWYRVQLGSGTAVAWKGEGEYRVGSMAPAGEGPGNLLSNGSYDPARRSLDVILKSRGMGDCGESGSWVFDGQAWYLAEQRRAAWCAGIGADRWPTLYRAQLR